MMFLLITRDHMYPCTQLSFLEIDYLRKMNFLAPSYVSYCYVLAEERGMT